jgi:hypothetical protein
VEVVKFCIQEKVKTIAIVRLQIALAKSTHELKQVSYDFFLEELMAGCIMPSYKRKRTVWME